MPNEETQSRSRQTALVTGASAGIGYELAKLFAADRYDVVLVARNEERLNEVKAEFERAYGITARVMSVDLAEPGAADRIHTELTGDNVRVDALVNNAGFGLYGFLQDTPVETQLKMIQVNVTALTHLTGLFVKDMVARGSGRIMNVASTAAFQGGPLQPVYYASKAYVLSFTEAVDNGLSGTGVRAIAFCPGPTATEFHDRANTTKSRLARGNVMMSAETCARIGYRGMMAGKRVVIPGVANKIGAFATRLTPRSWSTAIARWAQDFAYHD